MVACVVVVVVVVAVAVVVVVAGGVVVVVVTVVVDEVVLVCAKAKLVAIKKLETKNNMKNLVCINNNSILGLINLAA